MAGALDGSRGRFAGAWWGWSDGSTSVIVTVWSGAFGDTFTRWNNTDGVCETPG